MNNEDALRYIAELAYNVGFGAKRHFASHDIVDKLPGVIGFTSLAVGVFSLVVPWLSTQHMSALLITLGILSLYVSFSASEKDRYASTGEELTKLFGQLKLQYFAVKNEASDDVSTSMDAVKRIEDTYYATSITKQLLFSDWIAHYKFFWQHQIGWVDEQLEFRFFRDKVPLSVTLVVLGVIVAVVTWGIVDWVNLRSLCERLLP